MTLLAMLQIEPPGGLTEALSGSPLLALAVLFGAGVLTSLTPCVYPMIPITASIIAGTAKEDQPKSRTVGSRSRTPSDSRCSTRCSVRSRG